MSGRAWFDSLPSLDREVNRRRPLTPKGSQVLEQRAKRAEKKSAEERCKDAVWERDGGTSRASGKPVLRAHVDNRKRGEVAHLGARSTNPAKKFLKANNVLLTAEEHLLSDKRTAPGGKALLSIKGRNANRALTFTMRDARGRVVWTRTSAPDRAAQTGRRT